MSEWANHRQQLPGGGSIWSRGRQAILPGGLWWLEQEVRCRGAQAGPFAMGPGWIIEFIEVRRGRIGFQRDGNALRMPWRRFVWVLPAFSVVSMDSCDAEFRFVALAGKVAARGIPEVAGDAAGSRIFSLSGKLPASPKEALERLKALRGGMAVEISGGFPPLVRRAKAWIEENYHERASMAALARTLGVSHAHLSREFSRAVGMSPLNYLHHLRSGEALGKLSAGERIVDASLDVGYNDLSRFYKHFRRLGCSAPGRYRISAVK